MKLKKTKESAIIDNNTKRANFKGFANQYSTYPKLVDSLSQAKKDYQTKVQKE